MEELANVVIPRRLALLLGISVADSLLLFALSGWRSRLLSLGGSKLFPRLLILRG